MKLSRIRKATARIMVQSAAIPQFTLDLTIRLLPTQRDPAHASRGRPGPIDILIKACGDALEAHPDMNASFDEDSILRHPAANVALAFATPGGLISPVIRDVASLTLDEVLAERRRVSSAAREEALTPEDLHSATFTISNLGPFGIERFNALVVPPQAAILAVGAMRPDGLAPVSLSCDHRVIDGAPAAEFLASIASGTGRLLSPDSRDA